MAAPTRIGFQEVQRFCLLDDIAPTPTAGHALFYRRLIAGFPQLGEVDRYRFKFIPFLDVGLGCEGLVRGLQIFLITVMRQ